MLGCAIALMAGKAILRILLVVFVHQPVTGDLGNDGGRRNGGGLGITLDDGAGGHGQGRQRHCIHQYLLRLRAEAEDCLIHAVEGGLINIHPVDGPGIHQHAAYGYGLFLDLSKKFLPPLRGELLGIIEMGQLQLMGQDHCRHRHRPCQGAAAGLVHSRHYLHTFCPGLALKIIKGKESLLFLLCPLIAAQDSAGCLAAVLAAGFQQFLRHRAFRKKPLNIFYRHFR